MKKPALAALMLALSLPALALDVPQRSPRDPRIQRVEYNELDVVQIDAGVGYSTHIQFAPDEQVTNISSGFSAGWEFGDDRNNLWLKPISVKDSKGVLRQPTTKLWNTNLTIVTNKRNYSFMLKLHEEPAPNITFRVVFAYPETSVAEKKATVDKAITQVRLETRAEPRNWRYSMQIGEGASEIAPNMAYDDGRFTYLRFPGNRDFPAVFSVADDKQESMVNTHIDPKVPDVLVVHRVSKQFYLRLAKQVVGVWNDAYDAHGVPPENGTTVPGVRRRIKGTLPTAADAPESSANPTLVAASPVRLHSSVGDTSAVMYGGEDPRAKYLPPGWNPNAPVPPAAPPLGEDNDD
jgi:P-type conjugative transfer protein VirB9